MVAECAKAGAAWQSNGGGKRTWVEGVPRPPTGGGDSRRWERRSEEEHGALELFHREVSAGTSTGTLAVDPAMSARWDRFVHGMRLLLDSYEDLELSADKAAEHTEAWVKAAVHRVFAGPLSALNDHEETASGPMKKRHAETTSVLESLFGSDVTRVPSLPASPEDMRQEARLPVPARTS